MTAQKANTMASLRYQSDKRQFGALLMVTGMCAVLQSLAGIATAIGPNGTTPSDPGTIPFWGFIGSLCICIIGTSSVLCGYFETVHDWGNKNIMLVLICFTQTAFIPYITGMTGVGKGTQGSPENNPFIPHEYNPSEYDVKFVGAMGIMSIMAYGFAFVGSISFMQFSLFSFQSGKAEERDGKYFKGRLGVYSFILFLAGLSQFVLGCYIHVNLAGGALEYGAISVAMLHINFPAIAVVVGLIQMFNAVWGFSKALSDRVGDADDNSFPMSMFFQWFVMLTLQIVTQISYAPGGMLAPAAPSIGAMIFGLSLMPAFLDYKMRNTPMELPSGYYTAVDGADAETHIDIEIPNTESH